MKYKHYYFFLLCLFIITSCSQADESQLQSPVKESEEVQLQAQKTTTAKNDESIAEKTVQQQEGSTNSPEEKSAIIPQYKINPANFNIEPIQNAPENVVLLTIDDAPDKHALEMARTLKELNVNAIFFVNGHFLATDEQKAVLKEIHDMGFPIGNHTMTHENLKHLSEAEQYKEIVELNDLVEEIIGERPKFFRAPHGVNTEYSRKVVSEEKMVLMNWSYGYDFMKDYMTKEALTDIMINTELLHKGANLLMHDREWTNAALKDIVLGLQTKGYSIADPQLIEKIE